MPRRVLAVTVGGETCHRRVIPPRRAFDDEQKQGGGQNGTHNLGHYVTGRVLRIHLLADEYPDSHGGVDVAARDGADRINHREQGEAESE
jgi:hypothetical protein